MDIVSDKPVILEWKFRDCEPLRTAYLVPLNGDGLLLKDIVHDDFESVTIVAADLCKKGEPV